MCTCHITVLIFLAGVTVILLNVLQEIFKGTRLLLANDLPVKAVITCMKQSNGRYVVDYFYRKVIQYQMP